MFAVMVTTSVQFVGVYLVFTTLIVPALAVIVRAMAVIGIVVHLTARHGAGAAQPQIEDAVCPRASGAETS